MDDQLLAPAMYRASVRFADDAIADLPAAIADALDRGRLRPEPGSRIAVAVGSRGIHALDRIVRTTVDWLRARGAVPFIVPAMGSHGGATAEGQAEVLASYGITERTMGVPVRSSMETVRLDSDGLDLDLFMDRNAWEADAVLLVNRVKPHTDFHGFPESGLLKMSVIGLGKHAQALAVHGRGIRGLKEFILPAARRILATGRILGGLAVVENAWDRTMRVQAAPADGIEPMERDLLSLAATTMARLPLDRIDVLIADEMGKDVSGTGLDTNVIGRIRILGEAEPAAPVIRSILVSRLTAASHGNAIGVGLADVITRELYDAIDFAATYENGLTSSFSERVKIPYVAPDHAAAVRAALRFAGLHPDPAVIRERARIVRVRNTLELSSLVVSAAAAEALRGTADVEIDAEPLPLLEAGRLAPWR